MGILRQHVRCHHRWQPSPMSTLDIHICTKWWSSFGVSWGSHQATAVTEAWSSSFAHTYSNACLCSDNQLGSNVLTFSLALIAAENCTRHIRIGPHRFPCASTTFVYIYTKLCICLCRREPYVLIRGSLRIYRLSAVSGSVRSLTQKVWRNRRVSVCLLLKC